MPAPDHEPGTRVQDLPIDRIRRDPDQARSRFAEDALDELAESIRQTGVVQPVVVRGDDRQGYQLIAGERRWRAAQRAGHTTLPALVRNDLSAAEAQLFGLIENLQRESLSVMDTAHGLARLGETHGLTHADIARRIGKSRVYVTHFLGLRQLPASVQTLLDQGRLSIGHGKVLAGLDPALQQRLAQRAAATGASVRRLERWVQRDAQRPPRSDRADLASVEQALSEQLGNRVDVRFDAARRRGELRVHFHDLDEFEGLLARMGLRLDETQ